MRRLIKMHAIPRSGRHMRKQGCFRGSEEIGREGRAKNSQSLEAAAV